MKSENIPIATVIGVVPDPPQGGNSFPPSAPPPSFAPQKGGLKNIQNDGGAREFLTSQKWPISMQDVFLQSVSRVPLRFFICDDSGSMQTNDGKRIAMVGGKPRFVECSRWAELTTALQFHIDLAHAGLIPTQFRLLNGGQPYAVGYDSRESTANVSTLKRLLADSPSGGTPLCRHIREVIEEIRAVEPQLRASGQKACVIIATDGESSDGNVHEALRPLKDMPAWVIVRLCTDSESIVKYWNDIDNILEMNLDILDDLGGEAEEVVEKNPWLTYAEPLHRLREFGAALKELDLLDEGLLSREHMKKLCKIFYGAAIDSLPAPEVDIKGFAAGIKSLNEHGAQRVWDPKTQQMRPWVDAHSLKRYYPLPSEGKCSIM